MKIIFLISMLLSTTLLAQDCTFYHVEMIFKGEIVTDSSVKIQMKFPNLDFIQYTRDFGEQPFQNDNPRIKEQHELSSQVFEVTVKDYGYDLSYFDYSRDYLPLMITQTDASGKSVTTEINLQKEDFNFEFYREEINVQLIFDLGEIVLE